MLANSLSLKIIRGTLLAFRDQLGFSASLLRSDNSFTMPIISWAYIVSAHHPAFPLAYTCMVSMSGSTCCQCDGAWVDATLQSCHSYAMHSGTVPKSACLSDSHSGHCVGLF